jgi:uncharacterized cupin superfamily protein
VRRLSRRRPQQAPTRESKQPPRSYLEISNRDPADGAEYPDDDLVYRKAADGKAVFTGKDGTA